MSKKKGGGKRPAPSGKILSLAQANVAMTPTKLAKLLSTAGQPVTTEAIRRQIRAGAPADSRGRISLAAYAAWLVQRCSELKA